MSLFLAGRCSLLLSHCSLCPGLDADLGRENADFGLNVFDAAVEEGSLGAFRSKLTGSHQSFSLSDPSLVLG